MFVGYVQIDRDGGQDVSAIKRVLRALKEERGLILFPEGTRTPDGSLQPAKPGVGFIAIKTQVPVVPVRIFGSFEAYGKGRAPRFGTPVSVVFGEPLSPADYDDPKAGKDRAQVASERIMAAIARLQQAEAQTQPGAYFQITEMHGVPPMIQPRCSPTTTRRSASR